MEFANIDSVDSDPGSFDEHFSPVQKFRIKLLVSQVDWRWPQFVQTDVFEQRLHCFLLLKDVVPTFADRSTHK